jgi:hypothetical protein
MPLAEVVDAVARSQIAGLSEKVDQHRAESQAAHGATLTTLTAQSVTLARMEERQQAAIDAQKEAAQRAEATTLSPAKIAGIVAIVGSVLTALGYGAPKVYAEATAPPAVVTPVAPVTP